MGFLPGSYIKTSYTFNLDRIGAVRWFQSWVCAGRLLLSGLAVGLFVGSAVGVFVQI